MLQHIGEVVGEGIRLQIAQHLVRAQHGGAGVGGDGGLSRGVDAGRHAGDFRHGEGAAGHAGDAVADGLKLAPHGFDHLGRGGAQGAGQAGFVRHDVVRGARLQLGDGEQGRLHRINVTADDGRDFRGDADGRLQGVLCLVRGGAVAADALNVDLPDLVAVQGRARTHRRLAERQQGHVVIGVDFVARIAVEQAVVDHGLGAQAVLFGGLEDQHHASARRRIGAQVTGDAQQGRRVAVVAAGVRDAGLGRGVLGAAVVVHGQGIHVGAQADGGAGLASLNHRHDARAADAAFGRQAHVLKGVEDDLRRAAFLARELGVGVEIPTPGGHVRGEGGEGGQGLHRSQASGEKDDAQTLSTPAPSGTWRPPVAGQAASSRPMAAGS